MKTTSLLFAGAVLASHFASAGVMPSTLWELNGNLSATIGEADPISAVGGWSATFEDYDGGAGSDALLFPAFGSTQGLKASTGDLLPNGGGSLVNNYTIMMDVKFDDLSGYVSLYQTAPNPGANDADTFIKNGGAGVGISGDYANGSAYTFANDTWYRIAIVNDLAADQILYYVNGSLVNSVSGQLGTDGRFSLYPADSNNGVFLFSDDSNETSAGALASLALWDSALSAGDIAEYGSVSRAGIGAAVPEPRVYAIAFGAVALLWAGLRRRRR